MKVFSLVLFVTLILVACSGHDTPENRVFAPAGAEFTVTFPGPPELSQITTRDGLYSKNESWSIAARGNSNQYLKAAALVIDLRSFGTLSDEHLTQYGMNYAESEGFENIEVSIERKSSYSCSVTRGKRKIETVPYIFLSRTCFGKRSIITQHVVSPASRFPTEGGTRFLNSLNFKQ